MADLTLLRTLLTTLLSSHKDNEPVRDDDSLFRSGRLDSTDAMEVAFFLEDKYGVDFGERGIRMEDLDSIDTMRSVLIERAA
jgi:acyl carrier protein